MKVIISEKPDVARKFKNVLEPSAEKIRFADKVNYYEGKKFIFVSARGHLFTQQMPEEINENNKYWKVERLDLPKILPLKFIDTTSKNYFQCIKKAVTRDDVNEVIVATDPDREGQLIWYLISKNLDIKVPVTRIWIKEWTAKGLSNAFKTRKDNSSYSNLEKAGLSRAQADYLIGLHATRSFTKAFGSKGNIINAGRVQSPTRHMVYLNDKDIKDFVPEKYDVINLETQSDESLGIVLSSDRLKKDISKNLNSYLKGRTFVLNKEETIAKRRSPKLFKTNTLLIEAGKKLGITANEVTKIIQELYQTHGLTTYPRTDIEQISSSSAKEVNKIIQSLDGAGIVDDIINEIKENGYTFQPHLINTKGGEMPHEAITPAYNGNPKSKWDKLNKKEQDVYVMIVKRFLQGFYPPAVIGETDVSTNVNYQGINYRFNTKGKTIIEPSWMKISGVADDTVLPVITNGKLYNYIDSEIKNKQTKPPARFTVSTLLDAMEHAGKYVDDEEAKEVLRQTKGIGTGATQSSIVDGLFHNGFLELKGKSIYPTQKTIQLAELLPESPLTSPMMTAQLETELSKVEGGDLSFDAFMNDVYKQVDDILNAVKNSDKIKIASQYTTDIKCPKCGKPLNKFTWGYSCSGYRDKSCDFKIGFEIAHKKFTENQIMSLINGKKVHAKGLKNKEGKTFECYLMLDNDFNVKFDFSNNKKKQNKRRTGGFY